MDSRHGHAGADTRLLLHQAARHEIREFFRFTVHARALVILVFGTLVLLGIAAPMLLFGLIDLAAALWTASALKSESAPVMSL